MPPRPATRALPAALLLLASAAPARSALAQVERYTLAGDRVAVYNLAGKLRVEGGTGSAVVVEVTRSGSDARQLRVETGPIGGRQTLRVRYPSDHIVYSELGRWSRTDVDVASDGTFGDDDDRGDRVQIRASGSGLQAAADLRVVVPRGKDVVVHLAVGDAHVANVDGTIAVSVHAAGVTSEHTKGTLRLDTGSGSVSVTDAEGEVSLDTGSGGVTLANVRGGTLHLDTGSGSIRGDDIAVRDLDADVGSGGIRLRRVKASRVKLDTGSGGTEVELLSNVDEIVVDAGSGGVSLRLPATTSAEVDIETGSGGIDSEFAVKTSRLERNHLRGTIGDGKGRIRIESGSGRVQLLKG